ncbi:NAD-P-binding protein [Trametes versicolor FP-101664 SS1]|uniref:NAD-P-binding protein n=1 Tax=Trametes versicolor (strain FP-101664) TaxID=717944 RepID=UPI0004623FEB|nr:NAD-P-binding protein [Trametes versicolor FP-101664 SS1]EIW52650.1 NAD-P-binding protein [Trametes versicolor FP-101664 SS1]
MSAPRVWFITGSSSGFGRETVMQALESGDKVVATLRKPAALDDLAKKYPADRLRVVKLDVTKPDEIDAAFAQAKAAFGRIDIVFNNAGYVAIGEVEVMPDDVSRPQFEVNFWGAVHVSQGAVRFFREENTPQGGLLLQNSSLAGLAAMPIVGFYSATKHALEGFSESLAKELDPAWNIKVISIIEPGAFKTSVFDLDANHMIVVPQHPAYANPALPVYNFRGAFLKSGGQEVDTSKDLAPVDASRAVAKIIALSRLPSPPLHFPLGKDAVAAVREKVKTLTEEIDAYESWSDDLGR